MTGMATKIVKPAFIATATDKARVAEIRKRMGEKGIAQDVLAKKIGVHPVSLNRYLTMKRGFTAQQIAQIEELLGPLGASGRKTEDATDRVSDPAATPLPGTNAGRADGTEQPGLQGFLERRGDDITPRERRALLGSRFKLEDGAVQDDEFWQGILASFRRALAARDGGAGGGGRR